MSKQSSRIVWSIAAIFPCAFTFGACFHRRQPEPLSPPPRAAVQQVEAPNATTSAASRSVTEPVDDTSEPYIESLIAVDSDVRLVLQKIAEIGNLELVIPGNIKKTISVRYIHVPVSIALKDVLARSGLRLGTGNTAPLPFDTVTVFYRLPANVDSLSVDGIMKRFGVSRSLAELIVRSRPPTR
jgi:hypothetical protein